MGKTVLQRFDLILLFKIIFLYFVIFLTCAWTDVLVLIDQGVSKDIVRKKIMGHDLRSSL